MPQNSSRKRTNNNKSTNRPSFYYQRCADGDFGRRNTQGEVFDTAWLDRQFKETSSDEEFYREFLAEKQNDSGKKKRKERKEPKSRRSGEERSDLGSARSLGSAGSSFSDDHHDDIPSGGSSQDSTREDTRRSNICSDGSDNEDYSNYSDESDYEAERSNRRNTNENPTSINARAAANTRPTRNAPRNRVPKTENAAQKEGCPGMKVVCKYLFLVLLVCTTGFGCRYFYVECHKGTKNESEQQKKKKKDADEILKQQKELEAQRIKEEKRQQQLQQLQKPEMSDQNNQQEIIAVQKDNKGMNSGSGIAPQKNLKQQKKHSSKVGIQPQNQNGQLTQPAKKKPKIEKKNEKKQPQQVDKVKTEEQQNQEFLDFQKMVEGDLAQEPDDPVALKLQQELEDMEEKAEKLQENLEDGNDLILNLHGELEAQQNSNQEDLQEIFANMKNVGSKPGDQEKLEKAFKELPSK